MEYKFFYGSIIAVWIILFVALAFRPLRLRNALVAVAGVGYSLLFDATLGEYLGLYYYIKPSASILYIILSAVALYPVIEVIFTLFLPEKTMPILIYTTVWLLLMLAHEIASLMTKTIVFTGWKVFPWSILAYITTFTWINVFYGYLKKRGL
ncbi:MAG: hypothetical protein ACM3TR_16785 [Caulobacteraceae bacterium]